MSEGHGFGQMTPKGGVIRPGEVYHPARDVVNIFPALLRNLVVRYNKRYWPDVLVNTATLMAADEATANDAICDAHDIFFKFLGECCRDSQEDYGTILRRLGWEQIPSPARQAYYMMLGTVTAGMMFASLRDVSMEGAVPPPFVKTLLSHYADEARRLENRINSVEESLTGFREAVKACRDAGLSYGDLEEALRDLKIGRAIA